MSDALPFGQRLSGQANAQTANAGTINAEKPATGAFARIAETPVPTPPASPAALKIGLRLQLICNSPRAFSGQLTATSGALSAPENLGMDAGSTGSYWVSEDRREMAIKPRGVSDRLGVDFQFEGPRDSRLRLQLQVTPADQLLAAGGELAEPLNYEFALDELISGTIDRELLPGVRLWIGRPNGDRLRAELGDRSALVFDAEATAPWHISATGLTNVPRQSLAVRMLIRNDATGAIVWRNEVAVDDTQAAQLRAGRFASLGSGQLTIPSTEGVYSLELRLEAATSNRLLLSITPSVLAPSDELLATRSVQFVVLEKSPPPADPTPFETLRSWTPANATLMSLNPASLLSRNQFAGVADVPLTNAEFAGVQVAELASRGTYSQTLPTASLGRPHLLTIRYWREHDVRMIVSIRQPTRVDRSPPMGIDTAAIDPGSSSLSPASPWGEHRVWFWPRVTNPTLLIHNQSPKHPLRIESISVAAGPARLAGGPPHNSSQRMAAIYLDKPLLIDAFSAPRANDPAADVELDDWNTFLQAGNRLVDHVLASGANAAVLNVCSEGGSLYPSDFALFTPRYDTGKFFSDGRDPNRKDVLELLMRLFDRAGLRLIPALELSTPLPALERQWMRDTQQRPAGISWTDSVGRELLSGQLPHHGLAPYYNILNRQVQAEVAKLVKELVDRYAHHSAFAGVGLQTGAQTYLQLPTPAWGRDPVTLTRFRQAMGSTKSTPNPNDPYSLSQPDVVLPATDVELNHWIDQQGSQQFAVWRAAELTAFLSSLANQTSGRPLILLTADYLVQDASSIAVGATSQGLDWRQLAADPNLIPMRLLRDRWLLEPALRIDDAKMNEDFTWDDTLRSQGAREDEKITATAGGLLFLPPLEMQLNDPAISNADKTGTRSSLITLYPQAAPDGAVIQRRLARLFDSFDPRIISVGGWTAMLSDTRTELAANAGAISQPQQQPSEQQAAEQQAAEQPHAASAAWLQSYAALPDVPFDDLPSPNASASVVRVRQYLTRQSLVIYAVNLSPWVARLELASDAAAGTPVELLGAPDTAGQNSSWVIGERFAQPWGQVNDVEESAGQPITPAVAKFRGLSVVWAGELAPGQLIALRVDGPTRGVVDWRAGLVEQTRMIPLVAQAIDKVAKKIAVLGRPRDMQPLENAGFEIGQAENIEGWLRAQHPPGCIQFSDDSAEGKRAVVLRNEQPQAAKAWLLTKPFAAPETGRMAVAIRAKTLSGNPKLRLAVEGTMRGQPVRYAVEIQPEAAIGWGEQPYWLRIPHLPVGDLEEIRVAIDLTGVGSVALDDLRLYDFFFTQREREELQRHAFVAAEKLRHGDLGPAGYLLDSHWTHYLGWLDQESDAQNPAGQTNTTLQRDAEQAADSNSANPTTQQAPTVSERIRQWLPRPLRF
ncbi:hypothetical protein SH139x_003396 [Planctomycetaceae bacterium SH139]